MPTLIDIITLVAARARKYADRGLGESNTKASMIEPILEALGWDIRDPDEVHREYRPTGKDSPVDYALKLMRDPQLFVEAKGLGETLADRKWITQVLGYAVVAGVEWCVLTDGAEFRFYNAIAKVDADEKMFCRVRLTEEDPAAAARTLGLLSRANLEKNLLEALWTSHFVDRRTSGALRTMLAAPSKGIVNLVRQQVPKLTPKQIADSVRRLDIRIEIPAVTLPEPGAPAQKKSVRPPRAAAGRGRGKSEPTVELTDLIESGLIRPPVRLFAHYLKRDVEATLLADGQVEFQGTTYDSCSKAAEMAKKTVSGKQKNTNGWDFWSIDGADGKTVKLDIPRQEFRRRAAADATRGGH